jgi:hypothetical protein
MKLEISIQLPASEMEIIEAETAVTAASMKLRHASRIAIAARDSVTAAEEAVTRHVRATYRNDLVTYYQTGKRLAADLFAAKTLLVEAEDNELAAEVEWENATELLTSLLDT